jgi:hypothetical protein
MFSRALRMTSTCVKALSVPLYRRFTTKSQLGCKVRVGRILEQAQLASPVAYKTVKESGHGAVRRNQLIWLAKHSLGKELAVTKKTPSPHDQPWDVSRRQCGGTKGHASWEGPTVWPHMW